MQRSQRALDLEFEKQERGVYLARRRVNQHRIYYSVRHDGEEQAFRTVAPGPDVEERSDAAVAWLWRNLNRWDPVTESVTPAASVFSGIRLLN